METVIFQLLIPFIVSFVTVILVFEHKVRFKELHLERARIIRELWAKINDRYEELIDLKSQNEPNIDKLREMAENLIDLRKFFNRHTIYFNQEIVEKFHKLYFSKFQANLIQTVDLLELGKDLRTMKEPLENEFRNLLGVK